MSDNGAEQVGWLIHPEDSDPIGDPSHFSLMQGGHACIPFFTEFKAAELTCTKLNTLYPDKPHLVVSKPCYLGAMHSERAEEQIIEMPCYGYTIRISPDRRQASFGRYIDCPEGEADTRLRAVEHLLVEHARIGVDVLDPAYVRGFEMAVESALQWKGDTG